MLGYGKYWTAGFSASQWHEITHHKEYGWAEFYFIHLGAEYDNHCQDWAFQFYLLGLRFWLSVADPWGKHPSDVEVALVEFLKEDSCNLAPKDRK